ncbi:MAG: hypothetical protein ABSF62_23305, partial [Bryobacteraceae bacterium]
MSHKAFAASEEDRQRFSALYGIVPDLLPNAVDCRADRPAPEQVTAAKERYGLGTPGRSWMTVEFTV